MRKLWLVLIIIVLAAGFLGPSFAAQRKAQVVLAPSQSGLYMWSAETRQFLQIDRVIKGVQRTQNELFRQVFNLEQRIKALEHD